MLVNQVHSLAGLCCIVDAPCPLRRLPAQCVGVEAFRADSRIDIAVTLTTGKLITQPSNRPSSEMQVEHRSMPAGRHGPSSQAAW